MLLCSALPRLAPSHAIYYITPQVLQVLKTEEQMSVARRLGWLNIWNPRRPDQYFDLDLSKPDERRMGQVLTKMAVYEFVSGRLSCTRIT
jgi:hypothetical protein